MSDFTGTALILAGHGSTVNAESSRPTWEQAERIKSWGLFAEVHVGLWKENPSFKDAINAVRVPKVFIAPLFTSEGYFTMEILPREFGLDGRITRREGKEIIYCDPLGIHPYMVEALLKSAQNVLAGTPVDPEATCLMVAGHGTPRNPNSKAVVFDVVQKLRALRLYGDCQGVFMEEPPFIRDWTALTDCKNIIVVPYFISDGLHSFEDIPVMLGISKNVREEGYQNPTHLHGRRLWYARALGAEPRVAEVIVALVRDAARQVSGGG